MIDLVKKNTINGNYHIYYRPYIILLNVTKNVRIVYRPSLKVYNNDVSMRPQDGLGCWDIVHPNEYGYELLNKYYPTFELEYL